MRKSNTGRIILFLLTGLFLFACSDNDENSTPDGDDDADSSASETDDSPDGDLDAVESDGDGDGEGEGEIETEIQEIPEGPFYDPWMVVPSSEIPGYRGFRIKRGIIHTHSPYSHDACDDEPFSEDGVRNEQCFEDCREGMCLTAQDFVFLTDHAAHYAEHEYPDVLLYKEGDSLIMRNEQPVANRLLCPDGHSVVVAAGTESGMMPIGIEHHIGETIEERSDLYNSVSPETVVAFQNAGALVFLQHTEGWEVETILDYPIDGIENYNLHQNMMDNMAAAIAMYLALKSDPETVPVVELAIMTIFQESEKDLFRWSKAVMEKPMPAAVATDSHRNAFPSPSPDGERIDSFRRMMRWFSNYLLIPEEIEHPDDAQLKEVIKKGRMYNAFDYLGYPVGFDFHAELNEAVYEMGDFPPATEGLTLHLTIPSVYKLSPEAEAPEIRARILKADDGDWIEVAAGKEDLAVSVGKGVYRAEVRMIPYHLREWLGNDPETYLLDSIWVYSNPIYVGMEYTSR